MHENTKLTVHKQVKSKFYKPINVNLGGKLSFIKIHNIALFNMFVIN